MSSLVNAVKDRIVGKVAPNQTDFSVPSTVVVPPLSISPAPQGAPERSDWASRLMKLGDMAKIDRETVEVDVEL